MSERILLVDDERKVLHALLRQLGEHFDIATAASGADALKMISSDGPFAVIVSDMRMPGMDGVEFLAAARECAPDSVRVMLTGNADQQTAIEAVNEGQIFRFLTKPCAPEALSNALQASLSQYRLIIAEKELLEKTLRGAITILTEVLSLTNPVAFGHASRVQRLVARLCTRMEQEHSWQIDVAAMLSQIGCVTVPSDTLERAYRGEVLQSQERQMLDAHPEVAGELIRNIPRLAEVADIVAYQQKGFDGSGVPSDDVHGPAIPLGARILRVAIDYDTLTWRGHTDQNALAELRSHPRLYDPAVLRALEALVEADQPFEVREFSLADVKLNAVLAEDVITPDGFLLLSRGQKVTPSVHKLLRNFALRRGLENRIRVRIFVKKPSGCHATRE